MKDANSIQELITNEAVASLLHMLQHDELSATEGEQLQDLLVQMAQERMHQNVVEKSRLSWANEDDRATMQVLYELALAHYEQGMGYEASSEFELLAVISDNAAFSQAMKKHLFALQQEMEFDDLVSEWVEDETSFFMHRFDSDFERKFGDHEAAIDQKLAQAEKLFI